MLNLEPKIVIIGFFLCSLPLYPPLKYIGHLFLLIKFFPVWRYQEKGQYWVWIGQLSLVILSRWNDWICHLLQEFQSLFSIWISCENWLFESVKFSILRIYDYSIYAEGDMMTSRNSKLFLARDCKSPCARRVTFIALLKAVHVIPR